MSNSEWATHSEELSRKALNTLEQALHDFSEGDLTAQQVILIVNTLDSTIRGLVPNEVVETIYQVRKALET
jgi:hypothetical protein